MSTTELAWFKSSYSGSDGDDCVEVAASPGRRPRPGLQGQARAPARLLPHRVGRFDLTHTANR